MKAKNVFLTLLLVAALATTGTMAIWRLSTRQLYAIRAMSSGSMLDGGVSHRYSGHRLAWHGGEAGPQIPLLYLEDRLDGTGFCQTDSGYYQGVLRSEYGKGFWKQELVWDPAGEIVRFGDQAFDRTEGLAFAIETNESGDGLVMRRTPLPEGVHW